MLFRSQPAGQGEEPQAEKEIQPQPGVERKRLVPPRLRQAGREPKEVEEVPGQDRAQGIAQRGEARAIHDASLPTSKVIVIPGRQG